MYTRKGLSDIANVAATIQKIEGWYPGSRSYRNNNPGNLRCANQKGMTACVDNFAVFPDYQTGYDAEVRQINLDASRGLTIGQFAAKYAPAQDSNDPVSYAAKIAAAAGLTSDDPLSLALGGSNPVVDNSLADTRSETNPWLWGGILAFVAVLVWPSD